MAEVQIQCLGRKYRAAEEEKNKQASVEIF